MTSSTAKINASTKTNTPKTPARVPETIAKPSTPNETQSISKDGFLIESHILSYDCHLYSRLFSNTKEVEAVKLRVLVELA